MNAPAHLVLHRVAALEKAIAQMGHTHTIADVLVALRDGAMQGFVKGESWIITQVLAFPRKKVCEIWLATGDLDDLRALHDEVEAFARAHGCTLLRALGRDGWATDARTHGWTSRARVYLKDLE